MERPYNVMETLVELALTEQLQKNRLMTCRCQQCINDVIALTLNNLPSKYASTKKGEVEVKAFYSSTFAQAEIHREIIRSMIVVANNPNHDELS